MSDKPSSLSPDETERLCAKPLAGGRLSREEGELLLHKGDIHKMGSAAHEMRLKVANPGIVTYVVDRNVNYTNVCVSRCRFCAFSRDIGDDDAYINEYEPVIRAKVAEAVELGATQILMQGGHHPSLPFEWYLELLRSIKRDFPETTLHSFSPPEVVHFSALFGMPVREVLAKLRDAGLDSLPGGGAEILSDRVRSEVSPRKCTADEWIGVMREAHAMGMRTTATMMFGHVETYPERIEHLERIRALQDETGGFTAFICWSYQPENTPLGGTAVGGLEYLRTLAVARLYLDNFTNLQASWVTMGPKVGQLALYFGANDMGGTMLEENVVAAAGTAYSMTEAELRRLISAAGFTPKKRTTQYVLLE
ncbi:dehypoxanthine futalosine cyclase [bacterium]|nr:dehypoxanthine futalosine cyclase [bacterium]